MTEYNFSALEGGECVCGSGSYNKAALRGCGSYNKAALKGCGSYNKAALKGCGSYNKAALKGCGSYNKAALKGCGSYNKAALKGCGRGRGKTFNEEAYDGLDDFQYSNVQNMLKGGRRLVKGSPEAKAFMARLRSMRTGKRKTGGKCIKGSGSVTDIYRQGIHSWLSRILSDRASQKKKIADLKQIIADKKKTTSGGKIDKRDIIDFFAGPAGWVSMGLRKKREKEIRDLEKEAYGSGGITHAGKRKATDEEKKRFAMLREIWGEEMSDDE